MSATILIVDDQEMTRRAIRGLLTDHFPTWQVCGEAFDGIDAVEKVRMLKPDVLLMDISMPRMDGLTAARIIKKEFPEISIVIVSQNDPHLAREQARQIGTSDYVDKSTLFRKFSSHFRETE